MRVEGSELKGRVIRQLNAVRLIAFDVLAGALALLVLPAAGAAKADEVVKVCGASACVRTDDPGIVGALHSTFAPTPAPAPAPAPFYAVSFDDGQGEVSSYIYVPSVRAIRSNMFGRGPARWQDASAIRANLPDLTRFDPYPASRRWRQPAGDHRDVPWVPFPTASAHATVARVCGASTCVETDSPEQLGPLSSNIGAPTAAPAAAPFYVVSFDEGQRGEAWSYVYVPSVRAMRSDEFGHGHARWRDAPPEIVSALPDLSRLEPHPASITWSSAAGGQSQRPWALLPVALAVLLGVVVASRRGRMTRRRDPVTASPPIG